MVIAVITVATGYRKRDYDPVPLFELLDIQAYLHDLPHKFVAKYIIFL